eukprot:5376774-Amphidinium_carterae.1
MPGFSATLQTLTAFGNSFIGPLPEMHLAYGSTVLFHDNMLSCNLPRFRDAENVRMSLALLGNYIKEPASFP